MPTLPNKMLHAPCSYTQIILASIVPSLNNIIDVRKCFVKCHEAGFVDIYDKNQC